MRYRRSLLPSLSRSSLVRTLSSTPKILASWVVAASSVRAVANARFASPARRERRCTAERIGRSVRPISAAAATTASAASGFTTSATAMSATRFSAATAHCTRLVTALEAEYA